MSVKNHNFQKMVLPSTNHISPKKRLECFDWLKIKSYRKNT